MKKVFLVLLAVVISSAVFAQNRSVKDTELYKHYQMKYVFGMKFNDKDIAKAAMYDMIALDPMDDSLKFNLAILYYENMQYPSCLFVTNDLLSRSPDDIDILHINALCYQNMGVKDKAMSAFETLYLKNNDISTLYQVAVLQYELGRYAECKSNIGIITGDAKTVDVKLNFPKTETETQEISMQAAAYNLLGALEIQQGNKMEATKAYNKALELYPEFELAKQGLAEANK